MSAQEKGSLSVSHEGARRAVGRTPAHVGQRQRLRSQPAYAEAPVSHPRSRRAGIVEAEGNLQETRGQQKKARGMHVHPCCRLRVQPGPRLRTKGRVRDHEPECRVRGEAGLAEQR